jgi:hypothetical protein
MKEWKPLYTKWVQTWNSIKEYTPEKIKTIEKISSSKRWTDIQDIHDSSTFRVLENMKGIWNGMTYIVPLLNSKGQKSQVTLEVWTIEKKVSNIYSHIGICIRLIEWFHELFGFQNVSWKKRRLNIKHV